MKTGKTYKSGLARSSQAFGMLFFLFLFVGNSVASQKSGGESGSGATNQVAQIVVNGYDVKGEFLVIHYTINYPGVTKVKLFSGGDELLWRNQYLNEKGDQQVVLRSSTLISGEHYTFELEYKAKKQYVSVTL